MSFLAELKRRNVFKVGVAYAILAWLLVQIASVIFPALQLPDWTVTFIAAVLILGFPVAIFLAWAYEVTPDGIQRTKSMPLGGSLRRVTGQKLNYVVTGLLVIAVGYLAIENFGIGSGGTGIGNPASRTIGRLAVLPCDNLNPDPATPDFAPGIHDELLTRFFQIRNLRVISRTSVLQYAESRPPVPEIAEMLDADTIMECSVRSSGDELILTAQLIDGTSDEHLWANSYRADMSDLQSVFDMQVDLAVDVADEIRVTFLESDREAIERVPTESREAYELYLASLASVDRGMALVEEALAIDDTFADAWLLKAGNHLTRVAGVAESSRDQELRSALEAINRGIELAPDLPRAQTILGFYRSLSGDWMLSERAFRRARELNPNTYDPVYATLKLAVGQFAEAGEILEQSQMQQPLNGVVSGFLLMAHQMNGNPAARTDEFTRSERLFENGWANHVEMFLRLGDRDEPFLREVRQYLNEDARVWETAASNLDSPADALTALRALREQMDESQSQTARELAGLGAWAAYFGDSVLAIEALAEAINQQPSYIRYIWLPVFEPVRQLPDFEALLESLDLERYWETYGYPDDCSLLAGTRFDCA